MTDEREPLEHEQALLAHFRAHGSGEPSAELDARILMAASAAAPRLSTFVRRRQSASRPRSRSSFSQ